MVNAGAYPPPPPMPPPGGYGTNPPPPSGSNKSKIGLILGIVGGVLVLGCLICGGIIYFIFSFGMGQFEEQVRLHVEKHPKVVEHIGTISKFEWEYFASQTATDQLGRPVMVFAVTGSNGTGVVKFIQPQSNPATGQVTGEAWLDTGGQSYCLTGTEEEEEPQIEFSPSDEMPQEN